MTILDDNARLPAVDADWVEVTRSWDFGPTLLLEGERWERMKQRTADWLTKRWRKRNADMNTEAVDLAGRPADDRRRWERQGHVGHAVSSRIRGNYIRALADELAATADVLHRVADQLARPPRTRTRAVRDDYPDDAETRWPIMAADMRAHVAAIETIARHELHDADFKPDGERCPMHAELDRALTTIRSVIDRWPHDCGCQQPSGFYTWTNQPGGRWRWVADHVEEHTPDEMRWAPPEPAG